MSEFARQLLEKQPFALQNVAAYQEWRDWKTSVATTDTASLRVEITNPERLSDTELNRIRDLAAAQNVLVYQFEDAGNDQKSAIRALGQQIGLQALDNNLRADEDSITSLEVRSQAGNQYIPYTDKPLSWHTDGYYNRLDSQIRGIIMHCVRPAAEGGENALIDPELVYIRLRDEDPGLIEALMHPAAMTIPANIEDGRELRPEQPGPVFSVDDATGRLHMRYSARQRNIEWQQDELTQQAVQIIVECLQDDSLICRVLLSEGQGIICNNVLHNRTRFRDSAEQKRLMYRARYYDGISID